MSGTMPGRKGVPWRRVVMALVAVVVLIQFVPYGRDHANPPAGGEPAWDSPETRARFIEACADCHSHLTRWPWYSHVAPISWLVRHDVDEGRGRFNISEPGRRDKRHDAAEEVREGGMPILPYRLMHAPARLDAGQRAAFAAGLAATFGGEGTGEGAGGAAGGAAKENEEHEGTE